MTAASKSNVKPLRNQTEILTIFGECEAVIGRMMSAEFDLHIIDPESFPPSVEQQDDLGRRAKFAIVMPAKHLVEFHQRCARLRA